MCCFLTPWCSLTLALICDDGVSGASGKASSAQSRICFAALPCSVAAGFQTFQTALTEVQGQSGICSRTCRAPGSTRITSHPQCLPDFLVFKLWKDTQLSQNRLGVAKQHSSRGISHMPAHTWTCIKSLALPNSMADFSFWFFYCFPFWRGRGKISKAWGTLKGSEPNCCPSVHTLRGFYTAGAEPKGQTRILLANSFESSILCYTECKISEGRTEKHNRKSKPLCMCGQLHPSRWCCFLALGIHSPFQFLMLSKLDKEILLGTRATWAWQIPACPFWRATLSPLLSEKWVGLGGRGGGVLDSTSSCVTP